MRALLIMMIVAGSAWADPKPTIAVMIAAKSPEVAKPEDQARAIVRKLADAKTGPYLHKATNKDVVAAVTKAECDVMEPACAAKVGAALGIDYLLAGTLELRADRIVIQLGLFNVRTKQRTRSSRGIAVASTLDKVVRTVYTQLVDATTGELTVIANAKQGDVVLDGQTVGSLWEGRVTISGLALGNHALSIKAKGYKPIAVDVRIDGSNTETLLLEPGS